MEAPETNRSGSGCCGPLNVTGSQHRPWTSNVSPDQKWTLTPVGDGACTITGVNSGMVIEVAGASLTQGTTLMPWPLNGSTDQQWIPAM